MTQRRRSKKTEVEPRRFGRRSFLLGAGAAACVGAGLWLRRKEFSERDMAGNESFYNSEYEDLYTAMRTLPPKLRIVIHLFYYDEFSTKEIASLLHILEATVRTRLSRARKLLKIQLDNQTKERRAINEQDKQI